MKTPLFLGALVVRLPHVAPIVGSIAALTVVVPASAADTAPPADSLLLDPIIVTAARSEQPLSEALAAVSVITREEIELSQAGDIAELLRFQAGLEVARSGGPGQVASVFIRGGESNHTLVLVDGQRINPATAGGAALQNISPELIERIEIVRGPRATLYGSDAIGGVINIITRRPEHTRAALSARGGSDDTYDTAASLAYAGKQARLSLDADYEDTDGLPSCAGSSLDRGYRRSSVNARAASTLGGADLELRLWNAEGKTEYLDYCDPVYGFVPLSQDFQNQLAALEISGRPYAGYETRLNFTRMEDEIDQNQINYLGAYEHVRTVRPGLEWSNVYAPGEDHRISGGLEAARDEVDALSYGTEIHEERDLLRGYLQDELRLGRHHLLAGIAHADYEDDGDATTWNLEYGYDLRHATRLLASAGSGFRAPDATDRYGFGGNPDLDSERSRSYELGVQQRFGGAHSLALRLFRNEVEDLISVEFDPGNDPGVDYGYRAVNIDEYRNEGAELQYDWVAGLWSLHLGALWQDPQDEHTDQPLLRRAKRNASASLQRRWGALNLGLQVLASGERPDVDVQTGAPLQDGGYTLFNLTGSYAVTPQWSLQGRLENLLDKDYQTAAGYEQPGLAAYLGLRWQR